MGMFDKVKEVLKSTLESILGNSDSSIQVKKESVQAVESNFKVETELPKEEKIKKEPSKPECEYGKCYIYKDKLCCDCAEDVACEKKSKFGADERLEPELVDYYKAYDEYLKIPNKFTMTANEQGAKVARCFIRAYQPKLLFTSYNVFEYIETYGLENERTNFVKKMQFVNLPADASQKLKYLWDEYLNEKIDISAEICCKESLYNRSYRDFQYTVNAWALFSDPARSASYFKDTSVIDLNMFFDENGNIKPAGIDGRDGDTIYNLIESWAQDNEYTSE